MKKHLLLGAFFAALAVVLGAFGAHALKNQLSAELLQTYEIGVRYQFYHAFGLFLVFVLGSILPNENCQKWLEWAGRCFFIGILLFCGSLYLLAFREILPLPLALIGPLTPLGGVFFIGGWASILIGNISK